MAILLEPVSSYTRQYVKKHAAHIVDLEKTFGREIKIAERGNQILVNSGVKTSALDINKITSQSDLLSHIENNCGANEHAKNKDVAILNLFSKFICDALLK